ncbi:Ankyrin repeat family protein [Raphanus sativus]|nr:Ankyrin repeat family protein [Raphanus sativus]
MVAKDANLNERSNTSTQDENIYEKLKKAAQDGDIERLYKLIAEDQDILCHFDKKSLLVGGFVAIERSLVSIKGRGRTTHLHHVARTGDAELLSETAGHIAVKNHQLMVFKVVLGWVKRVNKEEILDWKDENGNTVFHIAASNR